MLTQQSTFSVLFYVRKNYIKKDGNCSIMVRITIDGENTSFTTPYAVAPDNWNQSKGKIKRGDKKSKAINTTLDSIELQIKNYYNEFLCKSLPVTPEKLKNMYLGKGVKEITLLKYARMHNKELEQKIGIDIVKETYYRYILTVNRLEEYIKKAYQKDDLPIRLIDNHFVKAFDLYLRTEYNASHNHTIKFMQRFRTLFLYAKYEYDKDSNINFPDPFQKYTFHMKKTKREVLTEEEIEVLRRKSFASERLGQVRDVFIFCCYTGLAYIDIVTLTEANIKQSFDKSTWIIKARQKTDVQSSIRLFDIPKALLDKYHKKLPNGKLLPVISNQKMNGYLKEIADICNINKKLTSHVARHTFATTICMSNGVPIESISKMLGHTNIHQTQTYAYVQDSKLSIDMEALNKKLTKKTKSIKTPIAV